jgi:hormone-sensitive lipase
MFHSRKDLYNSSTHVKVRLLYNDRLDVDFDKSILKQLKNPPKITKAIVHFHGGGFCCQDSAAHQSYTRKWSINVNVPIFSVDYRLAPKNAYPDPVNDCYQAYVWIVTQAKEQLGMDL